MVTHRGCALMGAARPGFLLPACYCQPLKTDLKRNQPAAKVRIGIGIGSEIGRGCSGVRVHKSQSHRSPRHRAVSVDGSIRQAAKQGRGPGIAGTTRSWPGQLTAGPDRRHVHHQAQRQLPQRRE